MKNDVWSTRKTISFESEAQYERYGQAARKRGLTTAKFLSWVAEAFIKFDGGEEEKEVLQSAKEGVTHIQVVCSKQERDSIKRLAQKRGMSMGQLLLLSAKSGGKKQIDNSGVLAAFASWEYQVEFGDLESAIKELKNLKSLLGKAKEEENGFN